MGNHIIRKYKNKKTPDFKINKANKKLKVLKGSEEEKKLSCCREHTYLRIQITIQTTPKKVNTTLLITSRAD